MVALPSPENENRSRFRNVVFPTYLEYRTTDKVQNPSNFEWYTPLSDRLETAYKPINFLRNFYEYQYFHNTAVGICHADHMAPSIRKSWQSLRRQAAVARSVQFARGLRPWRFFINIFITNTILDTILRPIFYLKHVVSDNGLSPSSGGTYSDGPYSRS
jgi:hypothetical protein